MNELNYKCKFLDIIHKLSKSDAEQIDEYVEMYIRCEVLKEEIRYIVSTELKRILKNLNENNFIGLKVTIKSYFTLFYTLFEIYAKYIEKVYDAEIKEIKSNKQTNLKEKINTILNSDYDLDEKIIKTMKKIKRHNLSFTSFKNICEEIPGLKSIYAKIQAKLILLKYKGARNIIEHKGYIPNNIMKKLEKEYEQIKFKKMFLTGNESDEEKTFNTKALRILSNFAQQVIDENEILNKYLLEIDDFLIDKIKQDFKNKEQ